LLLGLRMSSGWLSQAPSTDGCAEAHSNLTDISEVDDEEAQEEPQGRVAAPLKSILRYSASATTGKLSDLKHDPDSLSDKQIAVILPPRSSPCYRASSLHVQQEEAAQDADGAIEAEGTLRRPSHLATASGRLTDYDQKKKTENIGFLKNMGKSMRLGSLGKRLSSAESSRSCTVHV
jgi:hypothetical protein